MTALENQNYLRAVHEWKRGPLHLLCQETQSWAGSGHGQSKQKVRIQTETCKPNFAAVLHLCGKTDSDLAENSVSITIVFLSWLLKNVNERTGVGGTWMLEGASLPPTEGSGVWVDS